MLTLDIHWKNKFNSRHLINLFGHFVCKYEQSKKNDWQMWTFGNQIQTFLIITQITMDTFHVNHVQSTNNIAIFKSKIADNTCFKSFFSFKYIKCSSFYHRSKFKLTSQKLKLKKLRWLSHLPAKIILFLLKVFVGLR